jgi:hypothetical protein
VDFTPSSRTGGFGMTWIDELEWIFSNHLASEHEDMEGMNDEINIFTQYLIYEKFEEDEHSICCPFVDCKWEFKFTIKYQMEFDGGQE